MLNLHAGVMARTVADIALFNSIFSTCNTTLPNVSLAGYRIGYPTNWWANLGTEVCHKPLSIPAYPVLLGRWTCSTCGACRRCQRTRLVVCMRLQPSGRCTTVACLHLPAMPESYLAIVQEMSSAGPLRFCVVQAKL